MGHDLVFAIDGVDARLSEPVSLRETGPPTSDSYTDWITQHPQLLGDDVHVVATEVSWNGDASDDEVVLDVLGIGDDGRLVVGVVIVGDEPQDVLARALTQAAYASRLDPDALADLHARHLQAVGEHHDEDAALRRLTAHTGGRLQADLLTRPRMVVFCEQVSAALATTIVWLDEMGLDIMLQRLRAYALDQQTLLIVSRIFPSEPVTDADVFASRRPQAVTMPADDDQGSVDDYDGADYDGGDYDQVDYDGGDYDQVDHDGGDYDQVDHHGGDYDQVDHHGGDYDQVDHDHVDHDGADHDGRHHEALAHAGVSERDLSIPGESGYQTDASDADVVFSNGFGHGRQPDTP